jgi:hypothetical protein
MTTTATAAASTRAAGHKARKVLVNLRDASSLREVDPELANQFDQFHNPGAPRWKLAELRIAFAQAAKEIRSGIIRLSDVRRYGYKY